MIQNVKHRNNNTALENITIKITTVNSMKHGWCQAVNNLALREQTKMEKSAHRIQNNMVSEKNIIRPRMSSKAKECMPNSSDDKNSNN